MKKFFIVLALTGLVGTASAATVATFTGTKVEFVKGDDKKKKKKGKKAECCSSQQGAAASSSNGKACSKDGAAAGGCCKDKQAAQPAPAPAAKPQ
ncbi:MAG: hypothetical protein MUC87_05420 [Bacteroidia bacterium]|jgi:hypothetical protein|nr:hypothetical protein [Bacteroidia bacterium]